MKTVLVVDDEYLIRWALKEGLKDHYRILTAASVTRRSRPSKRNRSTRSSRTSACPCEAASSS